MTEQQRESRSAVAGAQQTEIAVLAGGCFWGIEDILRDVPGIIDTEVGEFSTPLRFISDNWGLNYLTSRIAKTHSFEHVFNFNEAPRAPVFGRKQAPAYGTPWEFPEGYDGWQPGTVPNEDHFV